MAVTTKKTFSAANGSTKSFGPIGIELNNQDDLDVYVTLSGGTRRLSLRQSSDTTATSSHPQVNDTTGLYFPAVSVGDQLYNYSISTDNNNIVFNNNLPSGAVVSCERRTRDSSSNYTNFSGGSTIRSTDLNTAFDESNFTAQEARNKAFELENKIFGGEATSTSFISSDEIVDGTIVDADISGSAAITGSKIVAATSSVSGTMSAADKTKLDSIEANATADQSNTEIRAAVEAATDSNVFTDADHTKLNGIETAATADQTASEIKTLLNSDGIVNAQVDASAAIAGTKISPDFGSQNIDTTGNILLDSDSNKLKIGDDEDLEIYHNGSNSYVDNTGTGQLFLRSDSGVNLMSETHPSQNYVVCTDGGSVALYHNGAKKIETGTNGVIVTGTLDLNGNLDVSGSVTLPNDSISTAHIADAELTTLASMQSGTASILASGTALTSTTAELNLLDGKSIVTAVSGSSTDVQLPTAKAVNDQIVNLLNEAGGFVPIANEVSFPNANPDPNDGTGTIVSIADAGGVVVDGSGVSTTGRTLGGATVTINGIDSSLNSSTIAAGKGMLVQTTSTLNTYTYHRLVVDEAGVANVQTLVSDFNERYRVGSSNPTGSLDDGDLFFNTSSNKMLVYNASDTSWDDVQSVGNYFINTISSLGSSSDTIPGGSATPNGVAKKFTLSNAGTYAQQHIVSINGVIQKPNSGTSVPSEGFAIDGSTIIFSEAPPTGSDYFIITIGAAVNIGTPGNNTVSTVTVQNAAINADKLATDAVITAKILNTAVTADKLATDSVITAKVLNTAITADKLATDAVTTAKILDDAVTADKLANSINTEIAANTAKTTNATHSGEVTGATALTIASDVVDEDNLKISNAGSDGQFLKKNSSAGGGLTWDSVPAGVGGATGLDLNDDVYLRLGTGNDLKIWHNAGADSYIRNESGNLLIEANSAGDDAIKIVPDGAVELYCDNELKLTTTTSGVKIKDTSATATWVGLETSDGICGWLVGQSNAGSGSEKAVAIYNAAGDETHLRGINNKGVELYYDNSKKLETTSSGASVLGSLYCSDHVNLTNDGKYIAFGDSSDLKIWHTSTNSLIKHEGTGDLYIDSYNKDIYIRSGDGNSSVETAIDCQNNGSVNLYNSGSLRAYTSSNGFQVYKASSDDVEFRLVNNQNTTAGATNTILSEHDLRTTAKIVFGRMNDANDFSAAASTTQGDIQFWTTNNGTNAKKATFINSGGLCFGTDTAAANALDDYEEGTWSPDFYHHSSVTNIAGHYTKIGRMVYAYFTGNFYSTASDQQYISNLPFVASNNSGGNGGVARGYQNYDIVNGPIYYIDPNTTRIWFYKDNGVSFPASDGNGMSFRGVAIYHTSQ